MPGSSISTWSERQPRGDPGPARRVLTWRSLRRVPTKLTSQSPDASLARVEPNDSSSPDPSGVLCILRQASERRCQRTFASLGGSCSSKRDARSVQTWSDGASNAPVGPWRDYPSRGRTVTTRSRPRLGRSTNSRPGLRRLRGRNRVRGLLGLPNLPSASSQSVHGDT